jgi:hypothetical protein
VGHEDKHISAFGQIGTQPLAPRRGDNLRTPRPIGAQPSVLLGDPSQRRQRQPAAAIMPKSSANSLSIAA